MSAPTRLADIATGRIDLFWLDPRVIKILSGNFRDFNAIDNIEHVEEIKRSIVANGWRRNNPITVRYVDGEAHLIPGGGETRLRAALAAIAEGYELERITVVSEVAGQNDVDRIFGQGGDNLGKPFTMLEDAQRVKDLMGKGVSEEDICRRFPCDGPKLKSLLRLLEMPEKLQAFIRNKNVSATYALQIATEHGDEKAIERISAGVQEVISAGKKATAKTVSRNVNKKQGHHYGHSDAKKLVAALQEIYALLDGAQRKPRSIIRDILGNYGEPLVAESA
jgi:ParB-like chromosome segregation protein Spo0J